jgi:hypothetical protein
MTEPRTSADVHGRAHAITIITQIRPLWAPLHRLGFAVARLFPPARGLRQLSLLHFARWSILRSIPYNGPPQVRDRLAHPLMIFDDQYNGLPDPYIEAFVYVLPRQLESTWRSSYGYVGTRSVATFTRQLKKLALPGAYFYSAYPDATVRMIQSAFAVEREHRFLEEAARTSTPQDFAVVYRGFLTRRQGDL